MIRNVTLTSWNTFDVNLDGYENVHLDFLYDGEVIPTREISRTDKTISYFIDGDIEILGHDVVIETFENGSFPLIVTNAPDFHDFDNRYYYSGELGPIYSKEFTEFRIWAPLASSGYLLLEGFEIPLKRIENGVFNAFVDGDMDGKSYLYLLKINGEDVLVADPYAKACNANGKKSFVVDLNKVNIDMFDENLPQMNSYLDAIIYEGHVRDLTIDDSTDIENKGKFAGLIEKGRKTKCGNPAGFDYFLSLGFTHLQLLPVLDYFTVDEEYPENGYNWGYDPYHFFCLEGSYSLNPNDPYSRILEFKKLVRAFHKSGVRINLDVVYNHVYRVKDSLFEQITPNYFFRKDRHNKLQDRSGCGNDFASERPMARKMIVDSIKHLLNVYHVDGFRFDLMGLIDIDTMKEIEKVVHEIKPDCMLYGEGWNMMAETYYHNELATMENASKIPNIAFFNDRYRNIVRGPGGRAHLDEKGYLLGNEDYFEGFKFVYPGSCFDLAFPKLFNNLNQSLNYVECHDNATLYDALKNTLEDVSEEELIRYVRMINKTLLLSFGIPFVHAGQEIGMSKFNNHNSYNAGDHVNKFSYDLLDKRYNLSRSFACYCATRKGARILKTTSLDEIGKNVNYEELDDILHVSIHDKLNFHIFINPFDEGKRVHLDKRVDFYFPFGYHKVVEQNFKSEIDIPPHSCQVFYEEKDNA